MAAGEAIVPSATTVYQISLDNAAFALVPVDVAAAGAYALFVEHGSGEVETGLASPEGAVLTAAASQGGDEEEEEEDEDAFGSASGSVWANAIAAAFVVSAARYSKEKSRKSQETNGRVHVVPTYVHVT